MGVFGRKKLAPAMRVRLDKKVYSAGDVIEGSVLVDARAPVPTRGLVIHIVGMERSDERRLEYYGEDKREKMFALGCARLNDFEQGVVPEGLHEFPFSITLPEINCSSWSRSIRDRLHTLEYGVKYSVVASLLHPEAGKKSIARISQSFTAFHGGLAFNREEKTMVKKKTFDSCFGSSGHIDLRVTFEDKLSQGSEMKFVIKAESTGVTMTGLQVELVQTLMQAVPNAGSRWFVGETLKLDVKRTKCKGGVQSHEFQGSLTIPLETIDSFKGQIVGIAHYLQITVRRKGLFASSWGTKTPLTIKQKIWAGSALPENSEQNDSLLLSSASTKAKGTATASADLVACIVPQDSNWSPTKVHEKVTIPLAVAIKDKDINLGLDDGDDLDHLL